MARIILNTFGSYGDVFPYLAVGQCLRSRGHDPVLAAPEAYRSSVEAAGLEFAPVRPDIDYSDPETFRRVMDQKRGAEVVVREILVPHLRDSYQDLAKACEGADLLLSHVLTYAAPILGEKQGIPWVSTVLSPMGFPSAYDPPALAPIPWFPRLRPLGPTVVGLLWRAMKRVSWSWSAPIRAFRQELGLEPGDDPLWGSASRAHGVLALYSRVFAAPMPDWPEQTVVCGFPFYDQDFGGGGEADRLLRFLSEGPPPVVFSLGSSAVYAAGDFYAAALDAVTQLGHRAVLVVGDADCPKELPDAVLSIRSSAVRPLFDGASVIVHAGGIGTVGQAMRSGRPQIVIPFSHDHFDNARRVEQLGIGLSLNRKRLATDKLPRMLEKVLADERMQSIATSLSKEVSREDGPVAASEALERILDR